MKVLAKNVDLDHNAWLEFRRQGIGGSDAGAIAGLNPWKSAMAVYLEKTGQSEEIPDNERMRIGRDLEDYVAQRFAEAEGVKVRKRNAILQHPKHNWMLANIDREIVGVKEGLECKVTSSYGKNDYKDGAIPAHYELQCHHYMAVTGYKAWWLAVLIGNEGLHIQRIERDEEIIKSLIEIEKTFWEDHVLKNEMPAPDGSDDAAEIIKQKYPESNGEVITLLGDWDRKIERVAEIDELLKQLETEQKQIKQEIQLEMGEAEEARYKDIKIKWSTVKSKRIDSKALRAAHPDIAEEFEKESISRRFSIKF